MLNDCPDPEEVSNFHFLQLRTLRIIKENECLSSKSVNLVTSASKYDLLFVGVKGGFKILKLEDILALDEDKENRSILENYSFSFVSCDTPVLLAVNASQAVLAVCMKSVTGIVITFYSLSNFPGFDSPWQPFCSKVLSSPGYELEDFVWNPALEGLYAFCLSDGSLHIHDLLQTTVKPIAGVVKANALAVCWSPKGKQLVVGKQDGSFSQYKPSLDIVSTVMPPAFEDGSVSVTSICWISTTVFAVVYVANDVPNLFMVSTPKGGTITYTNFNDVCLGNNSTPDQKYLMHVEPSWGLLICASFDSIEIAVLGNMPNWVQWDLKEDGKALLPGKDGALNAVGMTVMYSAQKQIILNESVSYPPMPVMFFLTNNGLLVVFHMINEKVDAPALVAPPVPLELKICSGNGLSLVNSGPVAEKNTEKKSFLPSTEPLMPSPSVIGKSIVDSSVNLSQNVSLGMEANSAFNLSGGHETIHHLPGKQTVMANLNKSEAVLASFPGERKNQLQTSSIFFASEKENEVQSNSENSYMTAVISEIQSFEKELQNLKQMQNSLPAVSVEEDMTSLKVFALNLQNFQKDISETMQSLSSDIYTLKNVLLESFVLFEEASSREKRRNDHSYIMMLKERALDPITARHMQKRNQLFQYLSTQLQEVNNKLDQDWISHMSNKKKILRNKFCTSSTEAIYKTIVNNQKIIHNLKKEIDILSKRAEVKKLRNITNSGTWSRYQKRLPQDDLSKLADEFLQVKIEHQGEGEYTVPKKLSPESQNFLKDFLKKCNMVTVRPTAVYSPSQSRLLSNTVPSDDSSGPDQTQDISPKIILAPSDREMNENSTSTSETINVTTRLKYPQESTPAKPYIPVYEPITPPDIATTAPEPINKTYTCFLRENIPEPLAHLSSISATVNLNQGVYSSLFSSVKNDKELPKFSFASEIKSPIFSQTTSEALSSSSTVFSKAFSFTSKDSESSISKPFTVNSSTTPLPASGFQLGQKRDSLWSASTGGSSSAASTYLNNSVTPESSNLIQQDKPFEQHSKAFFTTCSDTSSLLSEAKISSASMPSVQVAEKILSPGVQANRNLSVTPPVKNSKGLFFESNKAEQTKKDSNTSNSDFQSGEDLSLTSVHQITFATTQSSSSQQQNINADSLVSTSKSTSSTILSNQTVMNTVLRTDSLIDTGNQSNMNNSDLSVLKQSLSLPDAPSESLKLSSLTFAVEPAVTNIPSSTNATVSSVTNTETITSQSSLSKLPSPTLTTLPLQNTSSSSAVLFEQTISTAPLDNSKTSKSDASTTSHEMKQTQITGQSHSKTSPFFSSPKTDVSTSSVTSIPALEQQPTSTTVPQVTPFGQPVSTSVAQTTLFGQPLSTTVTQTNLFGQPASASVTQTPLFGQPTSNSNFSSASGGFFSQTPTFGASDTVTTTNSDFSSQSSTFSFAKPSAFGQTTGSFGLAKSFFGQNSTSFTQPATPSSFSFNQNPSSAFGQGSFFSGLGGKPTEENASKNVFGVSSGIKSDSNNLFKNSSVKSFGTADGSSFSGTGGFSSGSGSVAQSGFGSFQQTPSQQPGSFGAAPAFGGNPAFGNPPSFGGSPTICPGNSLSSVFGQQQVSSNFSNFASASSPTFGSLASQGTNFGSPTFGSPPAFGASSFGGQSPSFGNPSSPPSNTSAFTQWRN